MFSGIGGFELGIEKAYPKIKPADSSDNKSGTSQYGERPFCVGYSEIEKNAVKIYEKHFKGHKNYGDATRIIPEELPDFDFPCGGFPCQAFSIAGKRGGFKDTRGTLFFEIARILSVKRPKLLLLENVKGLLSHDHGRTFGTILATLSELGYFCEWQVLNSKDFGVPQNRERVFIVGHLGEGSGQKIFPVQESGEGYSSQIQRTIIRGRNRNAVGCLDTRGTNAFDRADLDRLIYKNGIRRLTPIECERLQGFLDGWTEGLSDSARYKCLGNAVTVNVIQAIMERIL